MRAGGVLVFAEDPGAARYVAGLAPALADRGIRATLAALGGAATALREDGVAFETPTADAAALLDRHRPTLVITGTAENIDTLGLSLIDACRLRGIPSVGAVDAAMNAARRFRGHAPHALAHAPDYLLVPDEWTAGAFAHLGFPRNRITVCGHPHFDRVLDLKDRLSREGRAAVRARVLPARAQPRRVLTFVSEGCERIAAWDDRIPATSWLAGLAGGRTERALERFLGEARLAVPDAYVVLRLHPKDEPSDFEAYRARVDLVHHGGSALELVFASDLVVSLTSMLLTEAFLLGAQTLALIPQAAERDWLPAVRAGAAAHVLDAAALAAALHEFAQRGAIRVPAPGSEFVRRDAARRGAERVASLLREQAS